MHVFSSDELQAGMVLSDRYRLIAQEAEGNVASIWDAVDVLSGEPQEPLVLKVFHKQTGDARADVTPTFLTSLRRLVEHMSALSDDKAARVHEVAQDTNTGHVYLVAQRLHGRSLSGLLIREGSLGYAPSLAIIEQLSDGLAHAHRNHLVHSDLKPSHCIVDDQGGVRLIDFGVRFICDELWEFSPYRGIATGQSTISRELQMWWSLQAINGAYPHPSDDVYSLAAISYTLLGGRHPFGRRSATAALDLNLVVPPIDSLNSVQNSALARALSLRREDRTSCVEEFADGLKPRSVFARVLPSKVWPDYREVKAEKFYPAWCIRDE